jgi:phosphatidylglycerophosphate synthase
MKLTDEYKKSLKMAEAEEILDLIVYRPLAMIFVRLVYRTPITPNGVTFLSFVAGIVSAWYFAQGTASALMAGGIWFAIANVLDCSDGQLARLQGSGSPLGRLVDGVVDWAISLAIFSGMAIGVQRVTGDPWVWLPVTAAGLASALHAFMFDIHQQQFIATVKGQRNFVERELDVIRPELERVKIAGGNPIRRTFLNIYVTYLEGQLRSRSSELKGKQYPAELYRSMNKRVMRFWTLLGPTTNRTIAILAGLLNSIWIFVWPVLVAWNILLLVAILWQRRVWRRLDQALQSDTLRAA